MALITCPDCKTEISDAAPACPKCGRPPTAPSNLSATRASSTLYYAVIGFVAGFVLVWAGCAGGRGLDSRDIVICSFGGGLFAILGAILGSVVGAVRK